MTNKYFTSPLEDAFNPFEEKFDSEKLMSTLNRIDDRSLVTKFKATKDPINLAFDTVENAPLDILAREFVKDSFYDIISFITNIVK